MTALWRHRTIFNKYQFQLLQNGNVGQAPRHISCDIQPPIVPSSLVLAMKTTRPTGVRGGNRSIRLLAVQGWDPYPIEYVPWNTYTVLLRNMLMCIWGLVCFYPYHTHTYAYIRYILYFIINRFYNLQKLVTAWMNYAAYVSDWTAWNTLPNKISIKLCN